MSGNQVTLDIVSGNNEFVDEIKKTKAALADLDTSSKSYAKDRQKQLTDLSLYQKAWNEQLRASRESMESLNTSSSKFGGAGMTMGIRNASYQLQDFVTQVSGGQSAMLALGQQLPQLLIGFGTFGAVAGVVASLMPAIATGLGAIIPSAKSVAQAFDDFNKAAKDAQQGIASFSAKAVIDSMKDIEASGRQAIARLYELKTVAMSDAFKAAKNALTGINFDYTLGDEGRIQAIGEKWSISSKQAAQYWEVAAGQGKAADLIASLDMNNKKQRELAEALKPVLEMEIQMQQAQKGSADVNRAALTGITEQTKALKAHKGAQEESTASLQRWLESMRSSNDPIYTFNQQMAKLDEAQSKRLIDQEEYIRLSEKLWATMTGGSATTNQLKTDMDNLGQSVTQGIAQNANNAVNQFIDSIGKAKMDFTDFAASVVKDIAKMIVQMLIMQPIMASIKGFFGGGVAGVSATPAPTARGARALQTISGAADQTIPMIDLSGGSAQRNSGSNVVVNQTVEIVNNSNSQVSTERGTGPSGEDILRIFIGKELKSQFAGGNMDRLMRSLYGSTRQAV